MYLSNPLRIAIILACVLLLALTLLIIWKLASTAIRSNLIARFSQEYGGAGALITPQYRIQRAPLTLMPAFDLAFPEWRYANQDGSRDKRQHNNELLCSWSSLHLGRFYISCRSPYLILRLVRDLRRGGVAIPPHELEKEKGNALVREERLLSDLRSAQSIYQRFSAKPTDFEQFCAHLFERLGFCARVTPPTSDGGYDIELERDGNLWGLVECKCFNPVNHNVGRPLIQKLQGANEIARAPRLFFVTTSSFTDEAKAWANQTRVICIDGTALVKTIRRLRGDNEKRTGFYDVKWQLTPSDLCAYCPPDVPSHEMQLARTVPTTPVVGALVAIFAMLVVLALVILVMSNGLKPFEQLALYTSLADVNRAQSKAEGTPDRWGEIQQLLKSAQQSNAASPRYNPHWSVTNVTATPNASDVSIPTPLNAHYWYTTPEGFTACETDITRMSTPPMAGSSSTAFVYAMKLTDDEGATYYRSTAEVEGYGVVDIARYPSYSDCWYIAYSGIALLPRDNETWYAAWGSEEQPWTPHVLA